MEYEMFHIGKLDMIKILDLVTEWPHKKLESYFWE